MHSMTGFGRGTHTANEWQASVEASSVNRKQAEIAVNLPRELQPLENRVRQLALAQVSRGRVQISVRVERPEGAPTAQIRVNHALARSFESAFSELSLAIGRTLLPTPSDYIRQPGILEIGGTDSMDTEAVWEAIAPALEQAIANLNSMRAAEGRHLKEDFLERLGKLLSFTQTISGHAPSRPERQREMLLKRLSDMEIPLDAGDERLAREIALFADRCDISEELTRLHSHFAKFHGYIHAEEPAGRPLDFLCQELFREFNTIGSKANDALIAQTVVEAKTELEKLREQIQNIE